MKRGIIVGERVDGGPAEALRRGGAAVRAAQTEIAGRIQAIEGEMESLRGAWNGPASAVYQTLISRWRDEAARLSNVLLTLEAEMRQDDCGSIAPRVEQAATISGLSSMMRS